MLSQTSNRDDEWNALKLVGADLVQFEWVSAASPLSVVGVEASASPPANYTASEISTTNPLPVTAS